MLMTVQELACGYNASRPILDHINFQLHEREILAILGPNGVGKTTLFKTLLRLIPKLKGNIYIDGEDISKWSNRKAAQAIAYVAQNHVPPFPYLVQDVVILGRVASTGYFKQPTKLDHEIADEAMNDMGIYHLKEKPYTDISGGERQLVMLAQALAHQPKILFLDEPTASLDYGNQSKVLEKIVSLSKRGYAVVMTTHSPEHAFMCRSKALLLQKDSPVLFGTAEDILTEKNLHDAYNVKVNIVEYMGEDGKMMRMCSTSINDSENDNG